MPFDAIFPQTPSDLLLLVRARALIANPRYWTKLEYSRQSPLTGEQRYCPMAALAIACGNPNLRRATSQVRHLARLLVDQMPHRGGMIGRYVPAPLRVRTFNDAHTTQHYQVIALFDRAIDRLVGRCETVQPVRLPSAEPIGAVADERLAYTLNGTPLHSL